METQKPSKADLQLQVADAEASGNWPLAMKLKLAMTKADAPVKREPNDEQRSSLDKLRADIAAAENAREFAKAGRLKTRLLEIVSTI